MFRYAIHNKRYPVGQPECIISPYKQKFKKNIQRTSLVLKISRKILVKYLRKKTKYPIFQECQSCSEPNNKHYMYNFKKNIKFKKKVRARKKWVIKTIYKPGFSEKLTISAISGNSGSRIG